MLVGGTALAGFYAGHRRSDDLDLFTGNANAFRETVLAVRSLPTIGTKLVERSHSNQFYKAVCSLNGYSFTVDVVLDERFFSVAATNMSGDVMVAGLPTLFAMKVTALLSRCGEKDLYDLLWLFNAFPGREFSDLIELGREVDAGLSGETLVYSIGGTNLNRQACGFAVEYGSSEATVFAKIKMLQNELLKALDQYLTSKRPNTLHDVISRIAKL